MFSQIIRKRDFLMAFPKRILMRACCDPTVNYSTFEVIKNDHIWNNSGNMIFPYSIYRTLACEGVEITTYRNITPKDADFINENYDMFVIPLANAFRANHIKALGNTEDILYQIDVFRIIACKFITIIQNKNPVNFFHTKVLTG